MAPRIPVPTFVGGSNRLISPQADPSATINWFVESTRGGVKVDKYLRPTEGIQPHAEFAAVDSSAMLSQDGHAYVAVGATFGEFFLDGTTLALGVIAYDGTVASIVSNGSAGHQICIVSAGHLYIFDIISFAFTEVDMGGNLIAQVEFMDGYFLALIKDTRRVLFSALENGLVWDFDFGYFERSWGSDNISFIRRAGRQLWVVGTKTTEVWADTGNATDPFAPVQGVFIDMGCVAAATGQRDGLSLCWLSQDERGGGLVVRANGYQPEEISTAAIDVLIQQRTNTLSSAEAMVHQLDGHLFYWLHLEGIDTTPVYDVTEGVWTERAQWDVEQGTFIPHIARCHCYAFEKHFVGVRESGVIYELSQDFRTDGILP